MRNTRRMHAASEWVLRALVYIPSLHIITSIAPTLTPDLCVNSIRLVEGSDDHVLRFLTKTRLGKPALQSLQMRHHCDRQLSISLHLHSLQ